MYKDMTVVGKGIPLREGHSKVTGAEKFAPDRSLVGALWMKILRSPHPHARILKIDVSEALASPGVNTILTHEDAPEKEIRCFIFNFRGRILDDRVRFVGDEVAAVAAESEEVAQEALDLIQVEYEKLPAVFDIEEALKPDAPDVRGVGTNKVSNPPEPGAMPSYQEWGDIKRGMEEADSTVENEVKTSRVYTSFCPGACIAEWHGDKLTITLSHQAPYQMRPVIADVLGMPEHKVRLIAPQVAGTFGTLSATLRFWHIAALLSRKAGKPIIYRMTMEEYGILKSRESDLMRLKMGGKKDGTITALDYEQLHDNGGYGWKSTTYGTMHDILPRANVRYTAWGVNTNKFSTGCVRGVGDVPQAIGINQTVDMLAEKLGVDPLTIWKKNHTRAGDPRRGGGTPGLTLSSEAYDELIDKGAEAIEWGRKWKGWGKPYEVTGPRKRGIGMAVALHVSGIPAITASATIQINHDGTAQVSAGSMDLGTGIKTTLAQVCAEVLGLKVEDVYVVKEVDTETVPYAAPSAASMSMHLEGSAVKIAAADARRQLLEMAHAVPWSPYSLKKGIAKPEELDIKDSMIFVKADTKRRVPVKEIVSPIDAPIVIGRARRHDIPLSGPTAYATMAGFADVEVDTETGQVSVLKIVAGHDSGRIVNPEICENQVYGGVMHSLGYALMEEVVLDPETGKALNPALSDYWVPTSLDTPPMDIIFSENIDPVGPLGAKGIGEATAVYAHAAIASAIYNAIGVRMNELPITPDKVLKALGRIK